MRRDEVICQLRALSKLRRDLDRMEAALDSLPEDQREIIEKMFVDPVPKASDKICEILYL